MAVAVAVLARLLVRLVAARRVERPNDVRDVRDAELLELLLPELLGVADVVTQLLRNCEVLRNGLVVVPDDEARDERAIRRLVLLHRAANRVIEVIRLVGGAGDLQCGLHRDQLARLLGGAKHGDGALVLDVLLHGLIHGDLLL